MREKSEYSVSYEEVKNKKTSPFFIVFCILMIVLYGISLFFIGRNSALSSEERKLVDEYRLLKNGWYFGDDDLAAEAAMGVAYVPASSKGDAYTFYTSTIEGQGLSTDGKGFGFASHVYDGGLYVTEVFDGPLNRPALENPLKIGDVIYGVNRGNEEYYDFTQHSNSEVHTYLSEKQDTTTEYVFHIKRDGKEIEIGPAKRGNYTEILAYPLYQTSSSLVLKVSSFLGQAANQLQAQIDQYINRYGSLHHVVIDLRGNGGGDVSQAELMSDLFVKKGTMIYQMRDKNDKILAQAVQEKEPKYTADKYTILVDGNSASASEIFTLAMRSGTNCEVRGLQSYGKGIAQRIVSFRDGSALRYTFAKVFGPKRENETIKIQEPSNDKGDVMCIHHQGITPDVIYPVDYVNKYNNAIDFSISLGISEQVQNKFLEIMNCVDEEAYPDSYSAEYHFQDAIEQFAQAEKIPSYQEDGKISRQVTNRFSKISYDLYLQEEAKLLKESYSND